MAKTNVKTQTGNRVVIQFDGKQIGLVQRVRANDDYGPEPASGIGDIHAAEYVPTMARHSLSVSIMVLRKGQMREAGITAENGDDVLEGRVFDIVTLSKDDGNVMRKYIDCSYASGDVEVQKHAIIVSNASSTRLMYPALGCDPC